jgi:hypothetical protein
MQPSKYNQMSYRPYCIADPNGTLSLYGPGIWDDLDKTKNVSKFNLRIRKCKNNSEITNCSSTEEIDDWLEGK